MMIMLCWKISILKISMKKNKEVGNKKQSMMRITNMKLEMWDAVHIDNREIISLFDYKLIGDMTYYDIIYNRINNQ